QPPGTWGWDYSCAENNRNPISNSGRTLTLGPERKPIEKVKDSSREVYCEITDIGPARRDRDRARRPGAARASLRRDVRRCEGARVDGRRERDAVGEPAHLDSGHGRRPRHQEGMESRRREPEHAVA